MTAITAICLVLLVAFLGGHLAKHLGYPRIVGQLLVSFLFAIPAVQELQVTSGALEVIEALSTLGAILLIFLTGFDIDTDHLKKVMGPSLTIAVFASLIPFGFGIFLGTALDYPLLTSFVLGGCLAISSSSTISALLLEMKSIKSRIGTIMLGASFVDELVGLFLLTVLFLFAGELEPNAFLFFFAKIAVFAGILYGAFKLIPEIVHHLEREETSDAALLNVILVMALVLALVAEFTGAGAILGAALAGVIMQKSFLKEIDREKEERLLRVFAFAVIVPFFFVTIGLHFDYRSIIENPLLVVIVTLVALLGKLAGTMFAKPYIDNVSWRQMTLIGWGMNSRGIIGLVLAKIAFELSLIEQSLYSAIVFMAVFTTILFPLVLKTMLEKYPKLLK